MTFLFVDYDQGAGGEYLCWALSQTPQCNPLPVETFGTGRHKVFDRFGQEFLKPVPKPQTLTSPGPGYDVVPAHRSCHVAKQVLENICTMRIVNPEEHTEWWQYLQQQRLRKVLMAPQPDHKYFIGELRVLYEHTGNKELLRRARPDMLNIDLQLLAHNLEPTEQNRRRYLQRIMPQEAEPQFDYDLRIAYQDLFQAPDQVCQQLWDRFGIELPLSLLRKYQSDYETSHTAA